MNETETNFFIMNSSFDSEMRPHGFFEMEIIKKKSYKHRLDLLGVYIISGSFHHGEIHGVSMVRFMDKRLGLLTFQQGVVHGPVIFIGSYPLVPVSKAN